MTAPFEQQRFAALPALPRKPHVYAQARSVMVDVAAEGWPRMRVHVKQMGEGPPLLLVHGLMTSAYSFRYALAPLSRHFTCHALDLPGAGQTPAVNSVRHDAAALGRLLVGLQRALGVEGCACVANSMGGYVAMTAALDHGPGTFSRLLNVHSPGVPLARLRALEVAMGLPLSGAVFRALVRASPRRFVHRNVHYHDESLKSLEEASTYAAPLETDEGLEAFRKYLAETMSAGDIAAFADRLRAMRERGETFPVPMMLLYAKSDPMVPPMVGEALAGLIPSAALRWVEGGSHFMHVDAVERFCDEALPFLLATPPR